MDNVLTFVVQSGCEFLWLFFPRVMEIQTQIRVQACDWSVRRLNTGVLIGFLTEPEVVVHDEYLRGVLICLCRAYRLWGILGYRPVTTSIHYHITISQVHIEN